MSKRLQSPLQQKFYEVIFGAQSPAGQWFDIGLLLIILANLAVIMLDSGAR